MLVIFIESNRKRTLWNLIVVIYKKIYPISSVFLRSMKNAAKKSLKKATELQNVSIARRSAL